MNSNTSSGVSLESIIKLEKLIENLRIFANSSSDSLKGISLFDKMWTSKSLFHLLPGAGNLIFPEENLMKNQLF